MKHRVSSQRVKKKTEADGSVERHKAGLVVQGYTPKYGTDYEETFCPCRVFTWIQRDLSESERGPTHTRTCQIMFLNQHTHKVPYIYKNEMLILQFTTVPFPLKIVQLSIT